jgi:hypothetical protein
VAALCRYLLERCHFVVIEVPRSDHAHRVFSILHTRGLDLTDTDVLKAEVLGGIREEDGLLRYQGIWEHWEDRLGRDEFEQLFSHLRMIQRKAKQQLSIAEEVRRGYAIAENPRKFIDDTIQPMAAALQQIRACKYTNSAASAATISLINRRLRYLTWITNDAWIAPAMAHMVRHRRGPERVAKFLRVLDRLAFAQMILKKSDGERTARYAKVLHSIEEEREFARSGSPLTLLKRERALVLRRISSNRFGDENWCLPVMKRLDAEYAPLNAALPDYDAPRPASATVEHVLPKSTPRKSEWSKVFGNSKTAYLNRIGNLILLSKEDNDLVRNLDFEHKRKIFFALRNTSPFHLKQQIGERWNRKVIDGRSKRMVAKFAQVWGLRPGGRASRPRRS